MESLDLRFFDPERLASELSRCRFSESKTIWADDSIEMFDRNPVNGFFDERLVAVKGRFHLKQFVYGRILRNPLDDIGSVFVEAGTLGNNGKVEDYYENLRLQFRYPLRLSEGAVIPRCQINVAKFLVGNRGPYELRKDYKSHIFGICRTEADLSRVLPTSWFLKD